MDFPVLKPTAVDAGDRVTQVSVVHEVEEFGAELRMKSLPVLEVLVEAGIPVEEARHANCTFADVAVLILIRRICSRVRSCGGQRKGERRAVEPVCTRDRYGSATIPSVGISMRNCSLRRSRRSQRPLSPNRILRGPILGPRRSRPQRAVAAGPFVSRRPRSRRGRSFLAWGGIQCSQ